MQLRPYQQKAIDDLYNYFVNHTGNPLVVIPTGGGKSLIMAEWFKLVFDIDPQARILCITHVGELVNQNYEELKGIWPEAPAGIYSAGLKRKQINSRILFGTIQSLHKKAYKIQQCDMILIDECFAAGTMVSTPSGPKPIDKVSCGDYVYNQTGVGIVEAVSIKPANEIYAVEFEDGRKIRCTGNHPFFTERGWINASELEGHRAFRIEDMRALWQSVQSLGEIPRGWGRQGMPSTEGMGQAALLLSSVCKEIVPDIPKSPVSVENKQNTQGEASSPYKAWRERAITAFAAASAFARAWDWMGGRVLSPDEQGPPERDMAERIQIGHCEPGAKNRDRIGGRQSQFSGEKATGPQEGCALGGIRVVSVSREKREGNEPVFNLQVSGHPSYFANGVAVHNCHLVPRKSNTMYRRFLDDLKAINPHLKIIGFTATHYRVDSGELHFGDDALFTDIAHETPVKELIDAGYLSRPISPKSASDGFQIDTTGIKTSMGDFMANQLEVPAMEPEAINAVVSKVIDAGRDRHGWLVFGVTVKHCRMLIDEFGARGISCDGIFGDTENRGDIIDDYKARKIRCLVSQGVLTTGFNARHVDLIALARPTKSTGLYVQMIGRGTRLSPETSKENCLILDFGGNIARHGPFDDPAPPKNKAKGKGNADPLVKYCPECEADNPIAASTCYCCGYEFPGPERKVFSAPSTASVMTEPPQWLNVDSISYAIHRKMGKPDSLKVTYMCGLTGHSEWICLDHTGYARAKAEAWWMRYASAPVPKNVAEALLRKGEIAAIGEIQVKKSGKYNEIVGRRILDDERIAA